jgi:hypothetical protein
MARLQRPNEQAVAHEAPELRALEQPGRRPEARVVAAWIRRVLVGAGRRARQAIVRNVQPPVPPDARHVPPCHRHGGEHHHRVGAVAPPLRQIGEEHVVDAVARHAHVDDLEVGDQSLRDVAEAVPCRDADTEGEAVTHREHAGDARRSLVLVLVVAKPVRVHAVLDAKIRCDGDHARAGPQRRIAIPRRERTRVGPDGRRQVLRIAEGGELHAEVDAAPPGPGPGGSLGQAECDEDGRDAEEKVFPPHRPFVYPDQRRRAKPFARAGAAGEGVSRCSAASPSIACCARSSR